MPAGRVNRLYEWLAEVPSPDAELILGAGLDRAEPAYFDRIVDQLFERGSEAAWAGLIANYPRLKPEVRERLRADGERFRSGLVRVLRGGAPQGRCNALEALGAHPIPALAYLLPDALRASSSDVRRVAALTLRQLAESVAEVGVGDSAELRSGRVTVAQAAAEGLRSFDLHYRIEVVEVSLWFAAELGRGLWEILGSRRSPTAHVVGVNLSAWNGPRSARFLLDALAQPAWRTAARDMLTSWRGLDRLAAILRNSDVLKRAEIRQQLHTLKRPAWFDGARDLEKLPPELRAHVPEWVIWLGFRPDEKSGALSAWLRSRDPVLRESAKRALDVLAGRTAQTPAEPAKAAAASASAEQQTQPQVSAVAAETGRPERTPAAEHAAPRPTVVSQPSEGAHSAAEQSRSAAVPLAEQLRRAYESLAQADSTGIAPEQVDELEKLVAQLRASGSRPPARDKTEASP